MKRNSAEVRIGGCKKIIITTNLYCSKPWLQLRRLRPSLFLVTYFREEEVRVTSEENRARRRRVEEDRKVFKLIIRLEFYIECAYNLYYDNCIVILMVLWQ